MIRAGGQKQLTSLAVGLAAMGACLAAVDAAIVRAIDGDVHPFVIAFFRASFGALVVLPLVILRPAVLQSVFTLRQHMLRAGLKLAALVAFFAAFAQGPLTDVTAIAFTSPLFVVVGAALMLGERLGLLKLIALGLGFVGALVILGPQGAGLTWGMGFALSGAVMQAVIQLMLKSMSSGDSTATLVVLNLLLTVPMAAVLAATVWVPPTLPQLGLLALQGVLGAACMVMMTHAFRLADASVVAPIDFLRLPLIALLGWLVFSETARPATWVGGGLISVAAMIASRGGRTPAQRAD
ncbi:DMT family transporter [Pseudorhodobacter sp. MZDSW-24AT]|uniref:DMT family transporter n=1 Tax=Pseudorhodobacter sp. MZDSW-24AT TaxID=2052957 RepID=UPI000C1F6D4B|nr:DMT family transporter [Pseudorhodobacter sp. MZDSW-24AT]PJF09310.1 EamA/RhaT family transporter [Pseudorhodobacter sp. MZDSW-24AT]